MSQFLYSATFDNTAVSTATDLFHVTVATDNPITLMGMSLGQTSDLSDANEEVLRIGLYRLVTGGSGGTAATEIPYLNSAAPAANAAVLTLNTTASTAGTLLEVVTWNIRVPLLWIPIPEMRPRFSATEDPAAFRLLGAPTDAITMSGTIWWREG